MTLAISILALILAVVNLVLTRKSKRVVHRVDMDFDMERRFIHERLNMSRDRIEKQMETIAGWIRTGAEDHGELLHKTKALSEGVESIKYGMLALVERLEEAEGRIESLEESLDERDGVDSTDEADVGKQEDEA